MAVTSEILARARRLHRESAEAILAESYPAVFRMAHGLTGNERSGRRVVDAVIGRCLRVLPRWREGTVPSNWFYHHTLLASRAAAAPLDDARKDLLVTSSETTEPAYLALVVALRKLPPQQMEAFLLHHGERLNPRLLGVAMDCSIGAATNHLAAATGALKAVAGDAAEALTPALHRAYWALTPNESNAMPVVRRSVRAARRARGLRLVRRIAIPLLATAGLVGAAWKWHAPLLEWARTFLPS